MKFMHILEHPQRGGRLFQSPQSAHKGRAITVATNIINVDDQRYIKIGYTVKHPNDMFNKRVGVKLATRHLSIKSSMIALPAQFKTYNDIQLFTLMILKYEILKDQTIKSDEIRSCLIDMIHRTIASLNHYSVSYATFVRDFCWALDYFYNCTHVAKEFGAWWEMYKSIQETFEMSPDFHRLEFLIN